MNEIASPTNLKKVLLTASRTDYGMKSHPVVRHSRTLWLVLDFICINGLWALRGFSLDSELLVYLVLAAPDALVERIRMVALPLDPAAAV